MQTDWIGVLLGFGLGLIPWLIDRASHRRQQRLDALSSWRSVSKQIELMLYKPDTTSATIHAARAAFSVDRLRATLGPKDFRLLEDVEQAYALVETVPPPLQMWGTVNTPKAPWDGLRERYEKQRDEAVTAFANRARQMQDEAYAELTAAENRDQLWRDYRAHPIKTWKRERHNKRVRAANPLSDRTPASE